MHRGKLGNLNYTNIFSNIYKGKKIFLTGHTGFKGSWLLTWLHLLGAEIVGYALEAEQASMYNLINGNNLCKSIIADIRNRKKLKEVILDFEPDFIFHLAAQPLVRLSYAIPSETFEVNAIGTANLLECVNQLKNKCSVIVVTTDKVYENKELGHPYKETDTLGGHDPYSASKACTELVVDSFRKSFFNSDTYNTHFKALASARAGNVIGGGDRSKDRIVPDIIRSLESALPITVRNPDSVRPWQHVLEPLNGYLILAAFLDKEPNRFSGSYNFGPYPEDHLRVKELVELAIKSWGNGTWVQSGTPGPHEANLLHLDLEKVMNKLAWKPKLNSSEAIQWTVDWYKTSEQQVLDYTIQQIKSYIEK